MRILIPVLLFLVTACSTNHQVDLILYNAKVYTVDSAFRTTEAFAVRKGVIVDLGSSEDILSQYDAKDKIDAQGKFVYPGFYDSHAHFMLYAEEMGIADLSTAKSMEEVIVILRNHEKKYPNIKWIVGDKWDQNKWEDNSFPTLDSLDIYFPDKPVFLYRVDYHMALANSKAFEVAALNFSDKIEGGSILLDSLNMPSGILIDKAIELVKRHIPYSNDEELKVKLMSAQDSLFAVGLTTIVDAGISERDIEQLSNYYQKGDLKIRNYAMIYDLTKNVLRFVKNGKHTIGRLTVGGVKIIGDGSLGSRSACMLEPYSDDPENQGFLLKSTDSFDKLIGQLANSSFQVSVHAIGDSTVRYFLDIFGKYADKIQDRRWRIEHVQTVAESDFSKFGAYHIIPSVQPSQATSDMFWAQKRLGKERMANTYAYKRLLQSYGKIAIGSDFPIESINPIHSFHAAVTRENVQNQPQGGFQMNDAISRKEALLGMTYWAAFACFQEDKRGSLERGKDADFVILDDDLMTAEKRKLLDIKVLRTVIAGETVYLNK